MARRVSTREYVLLGLLAVIAVVALFYKGAGGFGGAGAADRVAEADYGEPPVVDMARLAISAAGYDAEGRSLFKYHVPPPKVPERPPQQAPVERPPPPPPPRQPQRPVEVPPQAQQGPKPPPVTFQYLGFIGPKEAKIAVFEKDEGMLIARAGEPFEEHFVVLDFKYDSVVLGYTDERFKDQTTEVEQRNR